MSDERSTVLVIDDDSACVEFVRRSLEPLGFQVDSASSGDQGLEAVKRRVPDLIVLELLLPAVSGFEVIEALRRHRSTRALPVLVMSCLVVESGILVPGCGACAADGFLPKPAVAGDLVGDVERLLGRRVAPSPRALDVLLVEDNEYNADLVRIRLEGNLYHVTHATDGASAMEAFKRARPDIVLLDIQLPRLGGLEVLSQIREIDEDVMVIIMTAYGSEQIAVDAMKLGADDYLTKPVEYRTLRRFIAQAWKGNRLRVRNRTLVARLEASNQKLLEKYESLTVALKRLEENQAALVRAQRLAAVTETAVSINHEINNPLCSIMGNADLLLRKYPNAAEDMGRKLRSIERESLRIKEIMEKLANLANVILTDYAGGVKMIDLSRSLAERHDPGHGSGTP